MKGILSGGTAEHKERTVKTDKEMEKKESKRCVKVLAEARADLARIFRCTERMVYKALCYESDSPLAARIRYVALKEKGGWIEVSVPEDSVFYDVTDDGRHLMRQYFENGAVLEVSMDNGNGSVLHRGEHVMTLENMRISDIPWMQLRARSLR